MDGRRLRAAALVVLSVLVGVLVGALVGGAAVRAWWPRWVFDAGARAPPPPLTPLDMARLAANWTGDDAAVLVMWTGFFGEPGFTGEYGPDGEATPCPRRCLLENRRQYLARAKGVIFHARDVRMDDLPPRDVNGRQPWALATMETPPNDGWTLHEPERLRLFDYSMTYRLDSDFPLTYIPRNLEQMARAPLRTPLASKETSAAVAWVQSNCGTVSKREDYVAELMRHIPVHSYGRCMHNRRWPSRQDAGGEGTEDLPVHDLLGRYRFAILVENSDCADYWSEKFFNGLAATVVPIVNGPRAKYAPILPVPDGALFMDEHTPAELAALLHELTHNDTAYLHMLRYRKGVAPSSSSTAAAPVDVFGPEFAAFVNATAHRLDTFCAFCVQVHEDMRQEREYRTTPRDVVADLARRPADTRPYSPIRGSVVLPDTSCILGRFASTSASVAPGEVASAASADVGAEARAALALVTAAAALAFAALAWLCARRTLVTASNHAFAYLRGGTGAFGGTSAARPGVA